jgi:TetR/AcrR family transcriptional regulator, cholesterol catabolism regulator
MKKMTVNKPNTRKAQAEERRLQIMETALKVFAARGFKTASIKDIAEAAGISQGLMYHYFSSKEALLAATIKQYSFLEELRGILSTRDDQPADQVLLETATKFLNTLEKRKDMVRILIHDVAFDPELSDAWSMMFHQGVGLLKKFIDSRISRGELKPHNTEITARFMLSSVVMFHLTRDIFKDSRVSTGEYLKGVLDTLMRGIEPH